MTRISIVGANGYIGRHLAIYCLESCAYLNLFDIHETSIDSLPNYQKLDVCCQHAWGEFDPHADVIFMLSGATGTTQAFSDYYKFIDVNEKGLLGLLERMRQTGSKARVVFPSTRLVYKGQAGEKLAEESPLEFKTLYALNKHTCEQALRLYGEYFALNYSVARICIPYGNDMGDGYSYGTTGFFLNRASVGEDISLYGDGKQRRSFIHIRDLCDGLYKLAVHPLANRQTFNLGGPDDLSLLEAATMIAEKFGVKVVHKDWPVLDLMIESGDTVFDSRKAESLLAIQYENRFASWLQGIEPK